jgi:uncharacterized protein (DUF488 family)
VTDPEALTLYTIGFAEKSAENFFGLLHDNGVNVLVDTRLKPDTQLSVFAKQRDLPYLLKNLIGCDYLYQPLMCPTNFLLSQYRKDHSWENYEVGFNDLLRSRNLIDQLDRDWWAANKACLLCAEHEPDQCHRRLVAEYLAAHWPEVQIIHLL